MKEINLPSGNYLFVEVPDDCKPEQIAHNIINKPNSLIFDFSVQLISTTKDITEEQAQNIVGIMKDNTGNHYYNFIYSKYMIGWSAKESLHSLIQANELDVNKNYLILKKL